MIRHILQTKAYYVINLAVNYGNSTLYVVCIGMMRWFVHCLFLYIYIYCRVTDRSPHLDGNREWAQRAQYNKFVREWVEEFGW